MARFSDTSNPKLTAMLSAKTADDFVENIKKCIGQGAEAFCIIPAGMKPEDKTEQNYKRMIAAMEGRPSYFTNYIRDNSQPNLSDEDLAKELIVMANCGADLIDIRTDMFCRTDDEVTRDPKAVEKQIKLISDIKKTGAETLMSTHIFEYRSPEAVLEIAKLQEERGVDIAKVVAMANSEKELEDAFKTNTLLKEKLNIPFLFLCNGTHSRKHRMLGPLLGSCMYLCLENSNTSGPQPTLMQARAVRDTVLGLE